MIHIKHDKALLHFVKQHIISWKFINKETVFKKYLFNSISVFQSHLISIVIYRVYIYIFNGIIRHCLKRYRLPHSFLTES